MCLLNSYTAYLAKSNNGKLLLTAEQYKLRSPLIMKSECRGLMLIALFARAVTGCCAPNFEYRQLP